MAIFLILSFKILSLYVQNRQFFSLPINESPLQPVQSWNDAIFIGHGKNRKSQSSAVCDLHLNMYRPTSTAHIAVQIIDRLLGWGFPVGNGVQMHILWGRKVKFGYIYCTHGPTNYRSVAGLGVSHWNSVQMHIIWGRGGEMGPKCLGDWWNKNVIYFSSRVCVAHIPARTPSQSLSFCRLETQTPMPHYCRHENHAGATLTMPPHG